MDLGAIFNGGGGDGVPSPGTQGWLGSAIGAAGNIGTSYFNSQAPAPVTNVYTPPAPTSNNKTIMYAGGALVVALIIFLIIKKKQ